jgi:hypothetical protein
MQLFSLRLSSSFKRAGGDTWRQMSHFHYLSDEEVAASIADGAQHLRACVLDDTTSIAVISIPATSIYANADQATRLIDMLMQHSLAPKAYRAAGSDDIHIYLSFTEKVNSDVLNTVLTDLLDHSGFELGPTSLVIHPSTTALVLPLQNGFAWLNEQMQVKLCRDDITLDSALALFLSDLSRSAVSFEHVAQSALSIDQAEQNLVVSEDCENPTGSSIAYCLINEAEHFETNDTAGSLGETTESVEVLSVLDNKPDQADNLSRLIDYAEAVEPEIVCPSGNNTTEQLDEANSAARENSEFLSFVEAEPDGADEASDWTIELESAEKVTSEGTVANTVRGLEPSISILLDESSPDIQSQCQPPSEVIAINTQLSLFPDLIEPQVTSSHAMKKPKRPGRNTGSSSERSPPGDT